MDGTKGRLHMKKFCLLSELAPGSRASVHSLQTAGNMRRRLQDLGLTEHTVVECLGRSPGGDPTAYRIRGAVIALRRENCREILVEPLPGGVAAWN